MAQKLKFGNGVWANKEGSTLAYNDENGNYKPLPFNFTRSSSATRVNKQGLIEVVRNNKPRIDYLDSAKGALILEPSRSNLINYSESFDNAYWTKSGSSVTSGFLSPKGDLSAFKLIENSANSQHYLSRNITTGGGSYVSSSIYLKANGRTKARVYVSDNATGQVAVDVDLSVGTINIPNITDGSWTNKSATITEMTDNWYRVSITALQGAGTIAVARVYSLDDSGNFSYSGDGVSGIYIWGAQLELGSYPTSYVISNSGSITTRVAETANGSGNSEVFNDSEGVLYANIAALANDGTNRIISLNAENTTNTIWLYYDTSNRWRYAVIVGGVTQAGTYIVGNILDYTKISVKYKQNDFALWINGFEVLVDNIGSTYSSGVLTKISFNQGDGGNVFYGKTKELGYYDILTDTELEYLTSYRSWESMVNELNLNIIYNG